jgi:signal transduction histidine kinase
VGQILGIIGKMSLFLFFYLFPDGRLVPRWTRFVALALVLGVASEIVFPEAPFVVSNWPAPLFLSFMLGCLFTSVFAQVYRYKRVSGPVERQQIKWVVLGFAAALAGFLGTIFFGEVLFSLVRSGTPGEIFGTTLITVFMLIIPLSIALAILRYRLFDIDLLINRALVYGALTACVVFVYVFVVGYLGEVFRANNSLLVSLVATGIVAVLFAPLRDRLQRGVNHLMYGERDDPYEVISRLGERLEGTLAPEAVLPTVTQTVREALKLPYPAIALGEGEALAVAAENGSPVKAPLRLPLFYQREKVGELRLALRTPGEGFTPADRRLLDNLTRQAGIAVHAVRLTTDLQRSRERLVTTREEERRRLRRDLHDGLGPTLGSLPLKLDVAGDLVEQDPVAARELLRGLKEQSQSAVADIRRLVYELRPPALDELGLVGAIREIAAQYTRNGLRVSVEAPEELPLLPAAVEVAAYRIAQEALTNVARHATASECVVSVALDRAAGALNVEIQDDGSGIPPRRARGVGLSSMRERAGELGGGFVVESPATGGTFVRATMPFASHDEPDSSAAVEE